MYASSSAAGPRCCWRSRTWPRRWRIATAPMSSRSAAWPSPARPPPCATPTRSSGHIWAAEPEGRWTVDRVGYMRRVIELSRQGMRGGFGGPFGCVIVKDGRIVAEAHNEVLATKDPTAHAEGLAIRRASKALDSFDLSGCDLYTNGVPCCMCMGSILWARIDRVYYGLSMEE